MRGIPPPGQSLLSQLLGRNGNGKGTGRVANLLGGLSGGSLPDLTLGLKQMQSASKANNIRGNLGVVSPDSLRADAERSASQSGGKGTSGGLAGMLKQLGLDSLDLSADTSFALKYSRAQFQYNFQAQRSVQGANGIETRQINFSLKVSVEHLQVTTGQAADGSLSAPENGGGKMNPLERMKRFFSPEKTAGRILDFALSQFPRSSNFADGGNTKDSRTAFASFIGDAIQKGFAAATAILGPLPGAIQEGVDSTNKKVFAGLQKFITEGLDPKKTNKGGVYERIQALQMKDNQQIEDHRAKDSRSEKV